VKGKADAQGESDFWIARAVKKPGALRKALGVKAGKGIPAKKLQPKKGDSALMRKRKALARTFARLRLQ
jgi:hypothetical protein